MKKIPLTQGQFALVDDADYEWLNQWRWYCDNKGYAVRHVGKKAILMHRQIMNVLSKLEIDHKNRNRLDCQRNNLRICTRDDNRLNQTKRGNQKYKGVRKVSKSKKYEARIQFNGKRISLGLFNNESEAAKAYDSKALELHGQFACINF